MTTKTIAHAVDGCAAVPSAEHTTPQIDFDTIGRILKKHSAELETLKEYIDAGWTAAEVAEYARMFFLRTGRTRPTAESYRFALEEGPNGMLALFARKVFSRPDFEMPPLERPVARAGYEHPARPDHPGHSPDVKEEVNTLARLYMNQKADRSGQPRPALDAPIMKTLWTRCFKELDRYGPLKRTIEVCGLERFQ